jgi:hypothetical protein
LARWNLELHRGRSPIRYGISVVCVAVALGWRWHCSTTAFAAWNCRFYKLGVNAYVVKPVDFHEFVNAIKELGVFWAVINEPPPGSVKKAP